MGRTYKRITQRGAYGEEFLSKALSSLYIWRNAIENGSKIPRYSCKNTEAASWWER